MASDYLYEQSEVVRPKLQEFYTKKWNRATDLVKKGEVETIGERDFRIPFKLRPGGRVGTYDPNMGDMGRGSAALGDKFVSTFFNMRLNFELPKLATKATKNKSVAIKSAFKDAMADAMPEFMLYLDKFFHSDGTAVLATATAHSVVSGKSVYTLDSNFGVQRLRRGMYVTVYETGLATVRSAATLFIETVDYNLKKIKLSGTVASAANTDKICFEGVSGASPAGFKGLYYYVSDATSGLTLGIDRALEPEVISSTVDATAGLTVEQGMLLYHKQLERRGEVADSTIGLSGTSQQATVWSNIMALQQFDISGGNSYKDKLPEGLKGKSFPFAGVTHIVDIHQNKSRLDWIVPSTWGRAELAPVDFFELDGSGQRFFPLYGGSGGPAAGVWFGLTADFDFYCVDPGAQCAILNIPIASGY
jgi:hypothetical protein